MKDGLLEKIRAYGHWRVNLRPLTPLPERLTLSQCQEIVEQSRVSIRGWDYPHISHRNDDQSGSERAGEYFENWCDWYRHFEFWRMYRSGQFISYNALRNDTDPLPGTEEKILDIVDAIYTISEFTDFAGRLLNDLPLAEGLIFTATLNGTVGRHLFVGHNRLPFFEPKVTQAPLIEIERKISPSDDMREVAISVLLELFDHFGWNPAPAQLRGDQAKFYRREF